MYSVVVGCPRLVVYDKGSHVSTRYLEPLEDFFLECWPMTRPSQVIEVFYHACALLVGSWVMVDQSPYSVRGDFWRYVCPYRLSFVSLSRLELRWSCCYESGFMSTLRDWPRKGFVIALFLPAFPGRSARGLDTDYGVVESVRKAILQVKDNKVIVVNEPHPFMNMNWNVNFSLLCKLFFSPWGSCSKMSDNAHRARLVTRERVILYGDLSRVVPRRVGDTTVRCYLWCLMIPYHYYGQGCSGSGRWGRGNASSELPRLRFFVIVISRLPTCLAWLLMSIQWGMHVELLILVYFDMIKIMTIIAFFCQEATATRISFVPNLRIRYTTDAYWGYDWCFPRGRAACCSCYAILCELGNCSKSGTFFYSACL